MQTRDEATALMSTASAALTLLEMQHEDRVQNVSSEAFALSQTVREEEAAHASLPNDDVDKEDSDPDDPMYDSEDLEVIPSKCDFCGKEFDAAWCVKMH
jgi:hypothetical protein